MECIFYKQQYNIIYNISYLSLGSCIYAIYNKHYYISICPGGVFLTSINYWRFPDYSWRRYLDLIYVQLALMYQLYKAYNSEYMMYYYLCTFVSIIMYYISNMYYKKEMYWHSIYYHCLLHIFANIANIILYSGHIKK
jgi:hypothetical protein